MPRLFHYAVASRNMFHRKAIILECGDSLFPVDRREFRRVLRSTAPMFLRADLL